MRYESLLPRTERELSVSEREGQPKISNREKRHIRAHHLNAIPIAFGSVIGANVLTMSIMNFFELPTSYISIIYLACLALTCVALLCCRLELPKLSRTEHLVCVGMALLLFLPRVPYLFENLLGYALSPLGDDDFHVPNLASIIHTPIFPPRSIYDSRQYLAYYYAAWIPGAAVYYTGLLTTVKQALALIKFAYCFFCVYFPFYAARVLFSDRNTRIAFLVVYFLYGGFDFIYWISSLDLTPRHSAWWLLDFGFDLQFSNFMVLALWTPQHILAGLSILFALYLILKHDGVLPQVLAGVFFLSGLFTSPFTTFGSIPLVLWLFLKHKKLRAAPLSALTFFVLSLPLWWIFLGNDRVGFQLFGALLSHEWVEHKRAAFVVFIAVLLLQLGPLIVTAAVRSKQQPDSRWPFFLCVSYLLSTFFAYYSENYAMRGSIIPIFTLIYLSAPIISDWYQKAPRIAWRIAATTYLLGGLLEYTSFIRWAVHSLEYSNNAFGVAVLRSNASPGDMESMDLARTAENYASGWEMLEKNKPFTRDLGIEEALEMHADNRYRVTFSRVFGRTSR